MARARLLSLLVLGAVLVVPADASVVADGIPAAVPSAAAAPRYQEAGPSTVAARPSPATTALTATAAPPPSAEPAPVVPEPRATSTEDERPVSAPRAADAVAGPSGSAVVGALFSGDGHYCSASVVDSPGGDLVLTAAHCVHDGAGGGYYTDITFEPGYHDGVAPFGAWAVTRALVAPGWAATSDPDLDFAFLTVHQDGNPSTLESLTGADRLGLDRGFANDVTLTGYPDDADAPVTCQNTTGQQDVYQMRMDCTGFPQGTSGGPWVVDADPKTRLGTVIGVIGGYEAGGDPDVSYSSYFDADIENLYDTITAA
jgi:V8-like Glu-specific endopeptidase